MDIFPVSAGKYLRKVIKISVRLCKSVLSAISLLRPLLLHSRFLPTRAVRLAHAELYFGARRRVVIYSPVSAGKYLQEEIKTSIRLCESVLSVLSLLRPRLIHSRFPPTRAVCLHGWGFGLGRGGGYIAKIIKG